MSTREIVNHKLTIRDRMLKSGNMKLLNELFGDDSSQSITRLVVIHGKPQLVDIESVGDEEPFTETLADIYSNNPGLVNVHKRVKQALKERGLL
jgi:hypothetical protein